VQLLLLRQKDMVQHMWLLPACLSLPPPSPQVLLSGLNVIVTMLPIASAEDVMIFQLAKWPFVLQAKVIRYISRCYARSQMYGIVIVCIVVPPCLCDARGGYG